MQRGSLPYMTQKHIILILVQHQWPEAISAGSYYRALLLGDSSAFVLPIPDLSFKVASLVHFLDSLFHLYC